MATATMTRAARTRTPRPAAPTTFRLLLALGGTVYWVRPIASALYAKAFRLRRADGVYRWAMDLGRPRFADGGGGEFLGFVGSVIDVHVRRQAEEDLRRSEANARLGI